MTTRKFSEGACYYSGSAVDKRGNPLLSGHATEASDLRTFALQADRQVKIASRFNPNPDTGLVRWLTGERDGPSTNLVTVIVHDNGLPALSATNVLSVVVRELNSAPTLAPIANRTTNEGFNLVITNHFTVIVRDSRADFTVSLGSTNLLAGESVAVPVWLDSGLELQSLSFDLAIASPPLTNLALQPIAQEVGSAVLLASGPNRWQLEFTAASGFALQGAMPIGQLSFTAAANGPSAIVPLDASDLAGLQPNWLLVTNGASIGGRVIVVFQQPVLWCERQVLPGSPHQVFSLQLYGQPGHNYELQWSTNLTGLVSWEPWLTLPQTNRLLRLDWTNTSTPALFLHTHEQE